MKKAIFTIGISASGKSTWAREYISQATVDTVEINRDAVRFQMIGCEDWTKWEFTAENEDAVTTSCKKAMDEAIQSGVDIVISDTNLSEFFLKNTIFLLAMSGYQIEIKWMPIELIEALRRNSARSNPVPPSVINTQYERMQKLMEKYNQKTGS